MEKLVIELPKENWEYVISCLTSSDQIDNLRVNIDYIIKEVKIEDSFFDNDPAYHSLKKASNEAYKKLKNYEFNQRNK